jgi:hypothetical protein
MSPVSQPEEEHMEIDREVAALARLGLAELRARYAELFGEPTRCGNRPWLVKRLAWRLQALAEGDLSERARRRADELARDADLRLSPPRPATSATAAAERPRRAYRRFHRDPRLPLPGQTITRHYQGSTLEVQVLADGFAYQDVVYPSLSAVARAITGSHLNGFQFFGLQKQRGQPTWASCATATSSTTAPSRPWSSRMCGSKRKRCWRPTGWPHRYGGQAVRF